MTMLQSVRENSEDFRSGYPSGVCVGTFEVVLHYFYTPIDVPDALEPGSNNYLSIKEAERHGLLVLTRQSDAKGSWRLTDRGECLARAIMALPLPEQKWRMPTIDTRDEHGS